MGKYIDVEELKTELNKRIELLENGDAHPEVMKRVEGVIQGYKATLSIIDSLQQEMWKPSKEQMEALFTASERNDKLGSILNSLYYDLKNNYNG